MNIIVNGKKLSLNSEIVTIPMILNQLEVSSDGIAIAIGNSVVQKTEWGTFSIEDGAKITIIRATQGG